VSLSYRCTLRSRANGTLLLQGRRYDIDSHAVCHDVEQAHAVWFDAQPGVWCLMPRAEDDAPEVIDPAGHDEGQHRHKRKRGRR
jgi:hypothetical protein